MPDEENEIKDVIEFVSYSENRARIYFKKIETLVEVRRVRTTLNFGIITLLTDNGVCKTGCPEEIARRDLQEVTVNNYTECSNFSAEDEYLAYACNFDISANGGDTTWAESVVEYRVLIEEANASFT